MWPSPRPPLRAVREYFLERSLLPKPVGPFGIVVRNLDGLMKYIYVQVWMPPSLSWIVRTTVWSFWREPKFGTNVPLHSSVSVT